jgi:hypothetical protein
MKRRNRLCVYCAKADGTSKDHVVPDCLFVGPKPPNLLTVPACLACNGIEKSQDDTFLRDLLVVDIDNEHPIAKSLLDTKVRRSAQRSLSEIAKLVAGAAEQPRYDHEGTYLGEFTKVEVPDNRVSRIMCRIVRGLYYSERKQILPSSHRMTVLRQPTAAFSRLYDVLKHPPMRTFGDIFGYAWVNLSAPLRMIWLLWFYDSIVFTVSSATDELRMEEAMAKLV